MWRSRRSWQAIRSNVRPLLTYGILQKHDCVPQRTIKPTSMTKPQRVLIYCVLDHQGGVETHVHSLARTLAGYGAEVHVFAKWARSTQAHRAAFDASGVTLHVPPLSTWLTSAAWIPSKVRGLISNLLAVAWLHWSFKRASFEVVSIHAVGAFGTRLIPFADPSHGKVTYHEHLTVPAPMPSGSDKAALLARMHIVTANSQRDARNLRASQPSPRSVHVLPALAATIAPIDAIRPPPQRPIRAAFIGNVAAREKGGMRLLRFWRDNRIQDIQLTFYGPHGESLGAIDDLPNVRIAGRYKPSELSSIFSQIDMLIHPAMDESLGLVLIEAMAHGVPFVASHVGGIVDIAQDNPHVLTVDTTDEDLLRGIRQMQQRLLSGQVDSDGLKAIYAARWSQKALGARWANLYLSA